MYIVDPRLTDLSEGRFLQLKHAEKIKINPYSSKPMGFLPNGDLILVGYDEIYKYSFINKPTNESLWKYSQIYNINFTLRANLYQTNLFKATGKLCSGSNCQSAS